jgi:hypothetical protein
MPEKGFFASLFDIGFTSLITTRVIKVLYVLSMVLIGLWALILVIVSFANDPASGIFVLLIVAPLGALLYLIWTRVFMELIIVLFRIMENTAALVAQGGGTPSGAAAPAAPVPGGPAMGAAPPPATAQPAAAAPAPMAQPPAGGPGQPAGWYPDPQGQARVRYWDGSAWTDHTSE